MMQHETGCNHSFHSRSQPFGDLLLAPFEAPVGYRKASPFRARPMDISTILSITRAGVFHFITSRP